MPVIHFSRDRFAGKRRSYDSAASGRNEILVRLTAAHQTLIRSLDSMIEESMQAADTAAADMLRHAREQMNAEVSQFKRDVETFYANAE